MEKKKTLILLFMFVFGGVTLLGHTPALAVQPLCNSNGDEGQGMCYEIMKPGTGLSGCEASYPIYVVRAVDVNGKYPVNQPPYSGPWPFDVGDRTVFKYVAGPTQKAIDAVKFKCLAKPSAWSYIVFSLRTAPLGSDPPGASLTLDQLRATCTSGTDGWGGYRIAWKLNPNVNFGKDGTFQLYMPLGTDIDPCSSTMFATMVISGDGKCQGARINVPGGGGVPFMHWAHFTCDDSGVNVNVEFDECTGGVKEVHCDSLLAECPQTPTVNPTSNVWGYVIPPADPATSFRILNMGPGTPGVVICTGANSQPIYLRGNQAWWCGGAP